MLAKSAIYRRRRQTRVASLSLTLPRTPVRRRASESDVKLFLYLRAHKHISSCLRENYGTKVDVYSWAIAAWEIWSLKGKPFAGYDIEKHLRMVVHAGERPKVPMAWNGDLNELLATAWHFDQRVRCTAGHVVGVLTRLANDTGTDPLAVGKTRSLRSRISGSTKWLGLRSKSKSPKFGSDRKQFFPDDAVARPHP